MLGLTGSYSGIACKEQVKYRSSVRFGFFLLGAVPVRQTGSRLLLPFGNLLVKRIPATLFLCPALQSLDARLKGWSSVPMHLLSAGTFPHCHRLPVVGGHTCVPRKTVQTGIGRSYLTALEPTL